MAETEEGAAQPTETAQETAAERMDSALDAAIDDFSSKMGWEDAGTPEKSAAKAASRIKGDPDPEEDEPEVDAEADEDDDGQEELPGEDDELEDSAEDEGADEEEEDEPTEEEATDLERALNALRLAGVPSDVIENTGRAKLIAWGLKVAERESKRAADFEAKLKAREPAPAVETTKSAPAQAAAMDLKPAMQTIADELGVEPESATKAFTPLIEAIRTSVRGEYEERLSKLEQGVSASQAAAGQQIISANVERLAAAYPALRSDVKLKQKLIEKAHALSRAKDADGESLYDSPEAIFNDAAKIELGAPKRDLSQKRRQGVSTPPGIRGSTTAPKTWEEAMDRKLELIEAGRTDLAKRVPTPPMFQKQKPRKAAK